MFPAGEILGHMPCSILVQSELTAHRNAVLSTLLRRLANCGEAVIVGKTWLSDVPELTPGGWIFFLSLLKKFL